MKEDEKKGSKERNKHKTMCLRVLRVRARWGRPVHECIKAIYECSVGMYKEGRNTENRASVVYVMTQTHLLCIIDLFASFTYTTKQHRHYIIYNVK
jgi:hypothetical protein